LSSDPRISVLLADDHALVRVGIAALFEASDDIRVCGQAGDGAEAVALAETLRPDVALMDLSMPIVDGVEATRRIHRQLPDVRILVLTSFHGRERVCDALRAGAVGYLLKDCAPAELLGAVRAVARGESPLDPRVAGVLLPSTRPTDPADQLSRREQEVLTLVCQGLANKQIARMLDISERTVKVHLGNVFRRIGVADRTSAALWARTHLDHDSPL
jgi:DNA-binding NarL/FixJ family response regulator